MFDPPGGYRKILYVVCPYDSVKSTRVIFSNQLFSAQNFPGCRYSNFVVVVFSGNRQLKYISFY